MSGTRAVESGRSRCTLPAVLVVLVLGTTARADVDPSGTWDMNPDPLVERRLVVQVEGTAAKVALENTLFGSATGTWDAATATLHAGDPTFVGSGSSIGCRPGGLRVDAVVSADGTTMSGDMTAVATVITSQCIFGTSTFVATRATCGNFRIDAGESCDQGDVFALDDCCSDSCTFEPMGTACSAHGIGGFRCPTLGHCAGDRDECVPDPSADDDGDGLPNACDACDGGATLPRIRMRTDGAALVVSTRLRRPDGRYSPVSSGPAVSFVGTAADARTIRLDPPGPVTTSGVGWNEPRRGRPWTYASEDGRVTASVRLSRRFVVMKVTDRTPETVAAVALARFVSVQLGTPFQPCGQIDLTSAACITRRHTTVCRPRR